MKLPNLNSLAPIVAFFLFASAELAPKVQAVNIPVDIGPPRIIKESLPDNISGWWRSSMLADLNGTTLAGQSLSLDFDFGGSFIRLFTGSPTPNFMMLTVFTDEPTTTNRFFDTPYTGSLLGDGLVPLHPDPASIIGANTGGSGGNYHLFALDLRGMFTTFPRPLDIKGVRYDIDLPSTGFSITGMRLDLTGRGRLLEYVGVGIGDGTGAIPADIVPDTGSTALLLGAGLLGLAAIQRRIGRN